MEHITSIRYSNYKTFKSYSVTIRKFNILVGPNNSGKSTIIGSLKLLAEALRKARSRRADYISGPDGLTRGYSINLSNAPVATENVFFNYKDTEPAKITFRLSNGNKLILFFPEPDTCQLFCQTSGRPVVTPATFKKEFDLAIGFVPILGPVEHNEQLYQSESARLALITHKASRNFRNIWYHFPKEFDEFRDMLIDTWPSMDIGSPEIDPSHDKPRLHMFCPEERVPREIFWAGFGFQVWCQMLTFIVKNKDASLFLVDEPDIYLHSDLQRQLLTILREIGPDILIATHSTEIIAEADPDDILLINKKAQSAQRLKDPSQFKAVFTGLGSNMNPIMTQVAKTKRVLFVEGKDFQMLSKFAHVAGLRDTANRSNFAVIPAEGFNPQKIKYYQEGLEGALGHSVSSAVVFDRDYRTGAECATIKKTLSKCCSFVHIHKRKELENFLLTPAILQRAIDSRLADRAGNEVSGFEEDVATILQRLTAEMEADTYGQFAAHQYKALKAREKGLADATINKRVMEAFKEQWNDLDARLKLVSGKKLLAMLNDYLSVTYDISLTPSLIIGCHEKTDIPTEMQTLLTEIDDFGNA